MQIFSVQYVGGVAHINYPPFEPSIGDLYLDKGEAIFDKEPKPRTWTRRSRLFGFHDRRYDNFNGHHSPRNRGRKPAAIK